MDYLPCHILSFRRDPPKRSFQVLLLHLQSEQCSHSDNKNQYHTVNMKQSKFILNFIAIKTFLSSPCQVPCQQIRGLFPLVFGGREKYQRKEASYLLAGDLSGACNDCFLENVSSELPRMLKSSTRLDYQPLFRKMSPHSSPRRSLSSGRIKTGPGRRQKSNLVQHVLFTALFPRKQKKITCSCLCERFQLI